MVNFEDLTCTRTASLSSELTVTPWKQVRFLLHHPNRGYWQENVEFYPDLTGYTPRVNHIKLHPLNLPQLAVGLRLRHQLVIVGHGRFILLDKDILGPLAGRLSVSAKSPDRSVIHVSEGATDSRGACAGTLKVET